MRPTSYKEKNLAACTIMGIFLSIIYDGHLILDQIDIRILELQY